MFDEAKIIINEKSVSQYKHISDESGRWLEQHFCGNCGSNIGFTLEAVPGVRTIAAGTFDDPSWLRADLYQRRHVFISSAQNWATVPDNVEAYERHFR